MHKLTLSQPLTHAAVSVRCECLDVQVSQWPHEILTPTGARHDGVFAVHRRGCLRHNGQILNRVFLSLKDRKAFDQIPLQRLEVTAHRVVSESQFREEERGPDRAVLEVIGTGYLEPIQEA